MYVNLALKFPEIPQVQLQLHPKGVQFVHIEYYQSSTGEIWDRMSLQKDIKARPQQFVKGVALAQLIDKRKLKFEAFPNQDADQVSGFSDKAINYER